MSTNPGWIPYAGNTASTERQNCHCMANCHCTGCFHSGFNLALSSYFLLVPRGTVTERCHFDTDFSSWIHVYKDHALRGSLGRMD